MTYALDTNIISYLLQDRNDVQNRAREALLKGDDLVIPPLAYYEVRRGLLLKNAYKKSSAFEQMCSAFTVGEMTLAALDEAARQYAFLRRTGHSVDDADLLIAAFCITNKYTLITNNVRHFVVINGLRFENWLIY
jgi:predicted nucleic acid-binding protein